MKKEIWLKGQYILMIVLHDQWSQIWHKIYVRKCQIKLSETRHQSKEDEAIVVPEYSNFISYWQKKILCKDDNF